MKSMILAAGYGKRLGNLTKDTPKPLIEVKGKALIDFHIDKLIAIGCEKIVINVHYLAEKIINHVSAKYIDAIDIIFSHEENILGTGGGIKNAVKHFDQDDFLVIFLFVSLKVCGCLSISHPLFFSLRVFVCLCVRS